MVFLGDWGAKNSCENLSLHSSSLNLRKEKKVTVINQFTQTATLTHQIQYQSKPFHNENTAYESLHDVIEDTEEKKRRKAEGWKQGMC